MINSFYTLKALAEEYNARFQQSRVVSCFSQSKNELVLTLHDVADFEGEIKLRYSNLRGSAYLFSDARFSQARRNVAQLFSPIVNRRIESITIAERDRCLFIHMDNMLKVALTLAGSSANGFLVDGGNMIIDAFESKKKFVGQAFDKTRPAPPFPQFVEWREDIINRIDNDVAIGKALATSYVFFDTQLSQEILSRSGIDDNIGPLTDEQLQRMYREAEDLDRSLLNARTPCIFSGPDGTEHLAIYRPTGSPQSIRLLDTVDDAVRQFKIHEWSTKNYLAKMLPVKKAADKEYKSVSKAIENLSKGLAKPPGAPKYRGWADLLMANMDEPKPGESILRIPSFEDPDKVVDVPVKSDLTRTQLAEHYYNKAKKAEKRRIVDGSRLDDLKISWEHIGKIRSALDQVHSHGSWKEFESEYADDIRMLVKSRRNTVEDSGFRKYVLRDGYEVFVGRNAKQNDRLTTKFARKDDYWLHARGVPGSHVVLRVKGRETPPPAVLEEAAEIAAFHSKSRTSSLAPVIVVRKKYVRKRKGAEKGSVVVDREEVLLVEPGIPDNSQ